MYLIGGKESECESCKAKDYHIATLKEQIHMRDNWIADQQRRVDEVFERMSQLVGHYSGLNRANQIANNPEKPTLTSMPRRTSVQDRIRMAERESADPALTAERRKQYDKRIEEIMNLTPKPEIVVEESDAIQKSGTE